MVLLACTQCGVYISEPARASKSYRKLLPIERTDCSSEFLQCCLSIVVNFVIF